MDLPLQNTAEALPKKQVIFSGIQPSGAMTIGNYLGAIRNWVKLSDRYTCFYCVVDLHAITVDQEPALLRRHTSEAAAMLLACGIDPKKSTLFIQSHVPAHTQLAWVLDCQTYFGEARRMTQFKDKSSRRPENVNVGLFSYPVLMAADILLYNADLVPIGQDQKQHLELARTLAERFNTRYSETFRVPEGYIPAKSDGARIMSLADPTKKMSKSDENENAFVLLTDEDDSIAKKFRRAVTDSDTAVRYDVKNKPGISNLLTVYATLTAQNIADAEKECQGLNYGDFKARVADACIAVVAPLRARYKQILTNKEYLSSVLCEGRIAAEQAARRTMSKVYKKVGFLE